ncbi:MAG: hypothetical protein KDK39_01545 [Leptospiraceae bacterium]|nr:hypothetical protein [Leptospiraceae bacterium]
MRKHIKWVVLGVVFTSAPALMAEELPEASVDVTLGFASTYMFRGKDLNAASINNQRAQKDKGRTEAWVFQPDLTFNTPVEGLSFGLWGNFAISNREDTDTTGFLQQGPKNISSASSNTLTFNESVSSTDALRVLESLRATPFTSLGSGGTPSLQYPACAATTTCVPGFYKEQNGLKRLDEVDYTIAYERETSIGTLGVGAYYYTYPNVTAKASADQEVYVSYGLPNLPISFSFITDVGGSGSSTGGNSSNYLEIAYGDGMDIADGVALNWGLSGLYAWKSYLQGVQSVDASIGIDVQGFFANLNVTMRPDVRFHEATSTAGTENLPLEWMGSDKRGDGLIIDQSQNSGPVNDWINRAISGQIPGINGVSSYVPTNTLGYSYTYTPRQKLPRYVYWVELGYGFSI